MPSQTTRCGLRALTTAAACGALSCASPTLIPLLRTAGTPVTITTSGAVPLEIVTRGTSVQDPMSVAGSSVRYGEIEETLGHAVGSAAVPWADAHRQLRQGGFQLFVELTQADGEYRDDRLLVTFSVRATLRARTGNEYIGQTQVSCRQAALVPPDQGATAIYSCMARVGRDLTAWVASVAS